MSDKPVSPAGIPAKRRVYVVEDEIKLARLLEDYLMASGYQVQSFYDGELAAESIKQNTPDLILLDLMLPGKDGLSIAKEVRQYSNVPIIMVTAKVEEVDRLLGLEIGADDYVCKPFSPKEVVARVNAIFRRMNMNGATEQNISANISVNHDKQQVLIGASPLDLTTLEFQLFSVMFKEPGRIFSRQQLMDVIYSDHRVVSDRTIDSHIKKLRKKITAVCPENDLIHSIYGAGYKYELYSL